MLILNQILVKLIFYKVKSLVKVWQKQTYSSIRTIFNLIKFQISYLNSKTAVLEINLLVDFDSNVLKTITSFEQSHLILASSNIVNVIQLCRAYAAAALFRRKSLIRSCQCSTHFLIIISLVTCTRLYNPLRLYSSVGRLHFVLF